MKQNLISVCVCVTLILTIAKAQKYSKINKPVVDFNARPQVTTTPKLPEERRKLSIFPKSLVKYVVTSKPYSKVRSYSPWQVTTKRPLMQKLVHKDLKNLEIISVTNRPPLMKFTKPPVEISESIQDINGIKIISSNSEENTKNNFLVFPINNEHTVTVSQSSNFAVEDYEPEGDSTDKMLSFSSSVNNETPNEISSTEESNDRQSVNNTNTHDTTTSDVTTNVTTSTDTQASDLDNSRRKRLSVRGFSAYNYIDTTSNKDSYSAEERIDNDEFIFMNDKLRPVYIPTSPTDVIIEDDAEIATEIVWLEESSKTRLERSVNIIEEENMGTTVSGFKFTGREPRVNSHVVFKNINA